MLKTNEQCNLTEITKPITAPTRNWRLSASYNSFCAGVITPKKGRNQRRVALKKVKTE